MRLMRLWPETLVRSRVPDRQSDDPGDKVEGLVRDNRVGQPGASLKPGDARTGRVKTLALSVRARVATATVTDAPRRWQRRRSR